MNKYTSKYFQKQQQIKHKILEKGNKYRAENEMENKHIIENIKKLMIFQKLSMI